HVVLDFQRLPMLGKPIWFDATCGSYVEDFEYTVNGHWVRADGNKRFDSSLRVIHTSRRNESYEMSF
ncbi:hypothetical protein PRIPAC_76800, partial [Pristionchus pacificus]|uniref:Uncharacterized protein n=1 Tax=Pristionchus pacificus TaxID=54126 RepID=A0A2A6BXB5_PRIPA